MILPPIQSLSALAVAVSRGSREGNARWASRCEWIFLRSLVPRRSRGRVGAE